MRQLAGHSVCDVCCSELPASESNVFDLSTDKFGPVCLVHSCSKQRNTASPYNQLTNYINADIWGMTPTELANSTSLPLVDVASNYIAHAYTHTHACTAAHVRTYKQDTALFPNRDLPWTVTAHSVALKYKSII